MEKAIKTEINKKRRMEVYGCCCLPEIAAPVNRKKPQRDGAAEHHQDMRYRESKKVQEGMWNERDRIERERDEQTLYT